MTKTTENLIAALRAAFGENDVIQDNAQSWALEALVDALMAGDDPDSEEACGVYEYSAQGAAVYRVLPDGYLKSVPDYTLWEGVHWDGDDIVDNESGEVVGRA